MGERIPAEAEGSLWPGTGLLLVREGSRIYAVNGEKHHEISIEKLESMMLGIADMLHAARHWKEQGE